MPQKSLYHPDIGEITLVKRRGSRNLRLSFARDGNVKVSMPTWLPFKAGVDFAVSRQVWIKKHRPEPSQSLSGGDRIGKAHRLKFIESLSAKKASVRINNGQIVVSCPVGVPITSTDIQKAAERGAVRALKVEADKLLPQKLRELAVQHNFDYKSVETKRLSSRWGSCNQSREIILNTYLMQLPWELVDYVILHELVHTEHLNHGEDFWRRFESVLKDAKKRRKLLKTYRTAILPARDLRYT